MYTVNQIADYFLSNVDTEKGDTISPLKLQKLVYYAQAWHYTIFKEALFTESIEAWKNGPVTPSLYKRFAHITKYSAINLSIERIESTEFPEKTTKLLEEVLDAYGEHSASYLEDLTHSERPWINARGNTLPYQKCSNEITLESMAEYYSKLNESKA